jgi:hypothetical protein
MTQLFQFRVGANIEEAHMRNRQWVSVGYSKGFKDNVIEKLAVTVKHISILPIMKNYMIIWSIARSATNKVRRNYESE